jgi:hypothetical protein
MRKTATKTQPRIQTKEAPGWRRPGYPPAKEPPAVPAIAPTAQNPWSEYGAAANDSARYEFLKFSKGEYLLGKDAIEVAIGTHMVVNMDSLEVGWIKWVDHVPSEQRLGRIAEGFKPCKREELGDTDEADWPLNDDGKREDCWRFTNQVTMANASDGELCTFTTSSRGGLNAIGLLAKGYGEVREQHVGEWPIIALDVGSYQHSNRAYGRIKYPIFDMVGWSPKDAKTATADEPF